MPSAKPPVSAVRRREPVVNHRRTDAAGITLFATALIMVLGLLFGNAGVLGQGLSALFRTLFGQAAWLVPVVLVIAGVSYLRGQRQFEINRLSWGATLIFLSIVGFLARDLRGDYFDPEIVAESGGYLGAFLGWFLTWIIGSGKAIGLVAIGLLGAVLLLDQPIRSLMSQWAERARQRRSAVEPRTRAVPRGNANRTLAMPGSETGRAAVRVPDVSPAKSLASAETSDAPAKRKSSPVIRETIQSTGDTQDVTPKEGYTLPPMNLLEASAARPKRSSQEMEQNIQTLEGTLEEFGIDANVVEIATGPTITRYEIQLGPGIRVARITALADNIAMNLAASHVRVEAPIPGKAAIGVEVPNSQKSTVTLRDICDTDEFRNHPSRLFVGLGQDVSGVNRYADLTKMPHLLIGGATNSGKSIGLATIITSLIVRNTPKDLKLVMIDPKRVELSLFDGIPHLMCPVVKDVKEAPGVLRAVWREMDKRYDIFSEAGVRNIDGWNAKATFQERMPYIVVIIDELADLMIQAAAEVETSIVRLAQLARAVGIHLVIATQRPSVDVITGTIKANIPSRIAFSVSSQIDSRTILDQKGAEALMGRGDMLYMPIDASKPTRIQGCYVSEKEIEAICNHWKAQEKPHYVLNPIAVAIQDREADMAEQESDPLWEETVRWVVDRGQASTSMIQRRFSIGFQRASRLLDLMEERGIVGPRDGPRPREVLVSPLDVDSVLGKGTFRRDVAEMRWGLDDDESASRAGDPSDD
ncbi:MAG TPA: DNA translocase FtsK 4TM domain-containing protein [Fimbriimonadaceae bacterium]|nr:DNA translocase FtsK 4TM domain-containing protein [Fimbriimonadaceae bacterium]HRJ32494.1 DNA translocase FtsK 4TM domain-containing protein [Fimbriimonadaceae bacterium]